MFSIGFMSGPCDGQFGNDTSFALNNFQDDETCSGIIILPKKYYSDIKEKSF